MSGLNAQSYSPEVAAILQGNAGHTEAVEQLKELGVYVAESTVRRHRKALASPIPEAVLAEREAKPDALPKDMPVFAEYEGPNGRAALHLPRAGYTEEDLLREAGFDPDGWRIKGHVNTRKWMRYDQEWLFYYKFDVEQGESQHAQHAHVEDLTALIRKRNKGSQYQGVGEGTYVFVMSDWQIGKFEDGKGTPQTVDRYRDCLAQAEANIHALRAMGVQIDNLALLSVGDLVEGCGDHYSMQTFSVDLDRRSQNRIVRELITETILTLSPMFEHTTVAVVGGNHGENRKNGKAFTTFADNDDVGCPEAVAEAFALAGWENLDWVIPDEELSLCLEFSGVKIGLVHGHQFKGGTNALKKAEDWWRSNVFGMEPVNDAKILLSGHFHHFCCVNVTAGRSWMQAPTIDPGSKWYSVTTGITATPGVLTFVLNNDGTPFGYDFLRVLVPKQTDQVS